MEHLAEQRRYALQHTLRYQIWELDQPHYLQAAPSKANKVDSDQAERFAAVDPLVAELTKIGTLGHLHVCIATGCSSQRTNSEQRTPVNHRPAG